MKITTITLAIALALSPILASNAKAQTDDDKVYLLVPDVGFLEQSLLESSLDHLTLTGRKSPSDSNQQLIDSIDGRRYITNEVEIL